MVAQWGFGFRYGTYLETNIRTTLLLRTTRYKWNELREI